MKKILKFMKEHGARLDTEIAEATGTPLADVHLRLAELTAKGDVVVCDSIKFKNGKEIRGISCRLSECTPSASLSRKTKG